MNDETCTVESNRECDVRRRVIKVETELDILRKENAETHKGFGERIGDLEAHNKVQDVEVRQMQKSLDVMSDDLREVKAEAKEMGKTLPVIATQVASIHENSKAVDADVEEIKAKPGKRWDGVVGQIIALIVAALFGVLLVRLGLQG